MSFTTVKLDAISLPEHEGELFVGFYIGLKLIDTPLGESTLHNFERVDGSRYSVWGFTLLNLNLQQVKKGVLTKIVYTGKSKEKNKFGNYSHTCTVLTDNERRINSNGDLEEIDPNIETIKAEDIVEKGKEMAKEVDQEEMPF